MQERDDQLPIQPQAKPKPPLTWQQVVNNQIENFLAIVLVLGFVWAAAYVYVHVH